MTQHRSSSLDIDRLPKDHRPSCGDCISIITRVSCCEAYLRFNRRFISADAARVACLSTFIKPLELLSVPFKICDSLYVIQYFTTHSARSAFLYVTVSLV